MSRTAASIELTSPSLSATRVQVHSSIAREQCRQYGMKRGRKRVGHSDSTPRKPFLEIFRQEQAAPGLRRRGQHHRVPDRKAMIGRQVRCVDHYGGGRLDHRIRVAPAQHGFPRTAWPPLGFSNQYVEEFAQRLNRQHDSPRWQSLDQLQRLVSHAPLRWPPSA